MPMNPAMMDLGSLIDCASTVRQHLQISQEAPLLPGGLQACNVELSPGVLSQQRVVVANEGARVAHGHRDVLSRLGQPNDRRKHVVQRIAGCGGAASGCCEHSNSHGNPNHVSPKHKPRRCSPLDKHGRFPHANGVDSEYGSSCNNNNTSNVSSRVTQRLLQLQPHLWQQEVWALLPALQHRQGCASSLANAH